MRVRAKFFVQSKTEIEGGRFQVALVPVTSGSPENEKFYYYTPAGKIELATINASAAEHLKVGAEYFVDLTPAGDN